MNDEALADAVAADVDAAPVPPHDRALVEYARQLTVLPAGDSAARIRALRVAGFADAAILTATEVVGYFNFITRMAQALGVELEPHLEVPGTPSLVAQSAG